MKRTFFAFAFFASFVRYTHNMLSMNGVSETVQNLRISSLKIFSCAQLAILSDKNANIKQVSNLLIHYYGIL